jgi:phosphotransferase system enzyme I (PtsI)
MFSGTIIAPGIAFGPAFVWNPSIAPVPVRRVAPASADAELRRFEQALRRVRRELEEVALRVAGSAGESAAAIFRAHQLILDDPTFLEAVRRRLDDDHLAAESAVAATVDDQAQRIAAARDGYLAARADDLRDVGNRLLAHLRKEVPRAGLELPHDCVLVAENLAAADVVALDRRHLLALVMIQAGATSHAAILASTLGVPVVGGVRQLTGHVHTGDTVIVDGNHGQIVVQPTALAMREYRTRRALFDQFCGELAGLKDVPAVTQDGHVVRLTANIGLAEEVPQALAQGAEGVGLVRTELFGLAHDEPPSEDEQYRFYAAIVQAMAPRPVTFRTFDLGGDKAWGDPLVPEANPMLGCRGIRVLMEHRDLFVTQLHALLRASCHGPISIVFPLITSLTEFQDTMRVVRQVQSRLRAERVLFDEQVRFGCMIETPAAATIPDLLAAEVEFFSIGSNDLIQYTLAADRTNPRVAYMYEPLHLAVLRMMRLIIRAAHRRRRPVRLCGEMAGDPIYTIILLGLGVDELSVNPVMIPAIKQVIRGVSWSEARELARGVLRERRAKDVQTYLERMMARRFPQVMSIYGHHDEALSGIDVLAPVDDT